MKSKQTTFYCFSPPVMIATFVFEVGLLLYTLWRYKMSGLTRLTTVTLGFLALFQLAEYNVCGGLGMQANTWSRIGYVAITLLPPLGFHITYQILGKRLNRWHALAYGSAALWTTAFVFSERAFEGYVCGGNYVIFQLKEPLGGLYFLWYYAVLIATVLVAYRYTRTTKSKVKLALQSQIIGYALFMLPTSAVNLLSPSTLSGVPSIMCGFAVLFAITLVLGVMPLEKERAATVPVRRR